VESLNELLGPCVYLDANVVVYAVGGFPSYAEPIKRLLQAMDEAAIVGVTSELPLAEGLAKPKQQANKDLEEAYLRFLKPSSAPRVVPVSRTILVAAAEIRATNALKLPAAIHIATASTAGCSTLLTNDRSLQSWTSPPVGLVAALV